MTAVEEPVQIPASEKVAINNMGDKLKNAMAGIQKPTAPAAIAPVPEKPKPAEPKPANNDKTVEPKPPEKPAEVAKTEKPTEPKSPSRENFEKLESEAKRWREEANKLKPEYEQTKAKLAEMEAKLESTSKLQPEYEQAKQQLEEYQKLVKEFYVERDPQFQAHFGQRISTAVLEAKEAVGTELANKIEQVLQVPPSNFRDQQVAELSEGLNDFSKAALVSAYTELKRAERERKAELHKSSENYKKLQEVNAKKQQEEAAKVAENRNALLSIVNNQIEPELVGTEPELAQSIKANVKRMVNGEMDAKGYTEVLVFAAKGQKYDAIMKEKDDKIAKLEAQLDELQTTQPALSGSSPKAPAAKPGEFEDIGSKFRKARDGK